MWSTNRPTVPYSAIYTITVSNLQIRNLKIVYNPIHCQKLLTNLWISIVVLSIYACMHFCTPLLSLLQTLVSHLLELPNSQLISIFIAAYVSKFNFRIQEDTFIIDEVNGLYVFQNSWLWVSSSLQQNHCFFRYTALPTAATHRGWLLLKDTHSYTLLHTLPGRDTNRQQ